jgi:hypothetical protein
VITKYRDLSNKESGTLELDFDLFNPYITSHTGAGEVATHIEHMVKEMNGCVGITLARSIDVDLHFHFSLLGLSLHVAYSLCKNFDVSSPSTKPSHARISGRMRIKISVKLQ